jgi:Overcoming lysogenization defect protein-like, TOPRIM domain
MSKAVILVEGVSDQLALEALARRRSRDLEGDGVSVVAMGGAQAVGRYVRRFHFQAQLAGLCDEQEARYFKAAFEAAGVERSVFVCRRDLEDELIRALGVESVERVLADRRELGLFRSFQQQPAWRSASTDAQLRRFLGTFSGRKIQTAAMLVNALDLDRVPSPLDGVLAHVGLT